MIAAKPPARRRASQARSKATVQRILDAAVALIAEKNGEPFTMTEIAQRADVVLGSLYQYFSDRSAIQQAIVLRHFADVRIMLHHYLNQAHDLPSLADGVSLVFRDYYAQHQQDPFVNGVWSIIQTDAELQRLDIDDTMQNARFLQSVALKFTPRASEDRFLAACALLIQFAVVTSRFGRNLPNPVGQEMPDLFIGMIERTFVDIA